MSVNQDILNAMASLLEEHRKLQRDTGVILQNNAEQCEELKKLRSQVIEDGKTIEAQRKKINAFIEAFEEVAR